MITIIAFCSTSHAASACPRATKQRPSSAAAPCWRSIVKQNMALALGSIAALALPVLAGWLPLWVAVTLHEGSTLLVALNSLRLLHWPSGAVPCGAEDDAAACCTTAPSTATSGGRDGDGGAEYQTPATAAAAA